MDATKTTSNEMPELMGKLISKVEHMEVMLLEFRKDLDEIISCKVPNGHIPMSFTEACEFLRMKPSTLYYHLEKHNIPATRQGKSYILFMDELLKWTETGRTSAPPMTPEERNAAILRTIKRKPKKH